MLKFRSEVEAQGAAMEDTGGAAAAVPGQMSQDPAPMDQDPKDGGELSEEEQESWKRSELGRAKEPWSRAGGGASGVTGGGCSGSGEGGAGVREPRAHSGPRK
eukprot:13614558-Heterocapsa_arctica.AAC.1